MRTPPSVFVAAVVVAATLIDFAPDLEDSLASQLIVPGDGDMSVVITCPSCTSSVSQDIPSTHCHMVRFSQPVSSGTEGYLAHTLHNPLFVPIPLKSVSSVTEVGMFRRSRIFVAWMARAAKLTLPKV